MQLDSTNELPMRCQRWTFSGGRNCFAFHDALGQREFLSQLTLSGSTCSTVSVLAPDIDDVFDRGSVTVEVDGEVLVSNLSVKPTGACSA